MIRAIAFDLDHTLFDRYGTFREVMPEFFRHYREKIPKELEFEEFLERFCKIEKDNIDYGWYTVLNKCADAGLLSQMTEEETRLALRYIVDVCWPIAAVKYPFTEPTLKKLRQNGYKLGIITNGDHKPQSIKIKLLELEELVDEIVISGDVGVSKPSPEPFKVMSERLNIPPEEIMYVGNHPRCDVEGSRNAGYIPVWVKTTGHWYFEDIQRSLYEVDTVAEIPDLVEAINQASK